MRISVPHSSLGIRNSRFFRVRGGSLDSSTELQVNATIFPTNETKQGTPIVGDAVEFNNYNQSTSDHATLVSGNKTVEGGVSKVDDANTYTSVSMLRLFLGASKVVRNMIGIFVCGIFLIFSSVSNMLDIIVRKAVPQGSVFQCLVIIVMIVNFASLTKNVQTITASKKRIAFRPESNNSSSISAAATYSEHEGIVGWVTGFKNATKGPSRTPRSLVELQLSAYVGRPGKPHQQRARGCEF